MTAELAGHEAAAADRLAAARTLVVKVGSALLVDADTGQVDLDWLVALAADLARLRGEGRAVLAVSSGAVALGRRRLGLPAGRLDLAQKQAAAAAGQTALMRAWEAALGRHGIAAAQVLLTRDDTEARRRWLNARATLRTLLALGALPVVNENDTVATEELRWGDNDRLAARAAQMVQAQALVLLSDVDGLYTVDPRRDPSARRLPWVAAVTPEVLAMAGGANAAAGVGAGGMATKLAAARIAGDAGCATIIALGRAPGGGGPLSALASGARATLIEPAAAPLAAYKQWIAGGPAPEGALEIDAGAAMALRGGASLLPAGVRAVRGRFDRGDAVAVVDALGVELARGLAGYDAEAARRIAGLQSREIEAALGYADGAALIHRDDLVLR